MGIFNLFKMSSNSNQKPIRSKKDLHRYIVNNLGATEEIANLLCDAMEHAGRDCFFKFERGGAGNPYYVQYKELPELDKLATKNIQERVKHLRQMQAAGGPDVKNESLLELIAETVGAVVTIWINVNSEDEFTSKGQLIKDAYLKCKEVLG